MSTKAILDGLIADLKESVDRIDESTKSLATATTRLTYEIKNKQAIGDKYQLPIQKYQSILDFTQSVVNICTKFEPSIHLGKDDEKADSNNDETGLDSDGGNFEQFRSIVESRNEQIEKEIVKLNSLKEILEQISDE